MGDALATRAAGLMMLGFQGTTVPDDLRRFVEESPPAGVILFQRNITSTDQAAALIRALRALWPPDALTPLIAIDQEGGPVRRLRLPECPEFAQMPDATMVANQGDVSVSEEVGRVVGAQLASIGVNVDFAPVLDIDSNPANPVIGRRAFGTRAEDVMAHALAWAKGLESSGVLACGKHFPGHGDTDLDSHVTLPTLHHSLAELSARELLPFQAAVKAGFKTMMSAHIVFEALDPTWPATLSPVVIPTLLRERMGFNGVLFSDDLEMRAIADHQSPQTIAKRGLAATIDVFLVCHEVARAASIRDAIAHVTQQDEVAEQHMTAALARVAALRRDTPDHASHPFIGVALKAEGQALSARITTTPAG